MNDDTSLGTTLEVPLDLQTHSFWLYKTVLYAKIETYRIVRLGEDTAAELTERRLDLDASESAFLARCLNEGPKNVLCISSRTLVTVCGCQLKTKQKNASQTNKNY